MKEYDDGRGRPPESGPLFLHPDDDLAPNRPGEALHARLAALGVAGTAQGPRAVARRARTYARRLTGRPDPETEYRRRLAGEQRIGEQLETLTGGGWRVLHSLPLPPGAVLAHLLIGPGGVFALHTAHHRGARLDVGDDLVRWTGRGGRRHAEPYVRLARRAGHRASLALTRGCGFRVEARPVLALVGAARIGVQPVPADVRVVDEGGITQLGAHEAVLTPRGTAAVYAVARDRRTWLAA